MKRIQAAAWIFFVLISGGGLFLNAEEPQPELPKIFINGSEEIPTVQDLSGLATRPLRLLVRRNNLAKGEEWIQVRAIGAAEGDKLRIEMTLPAPGMRATLYKIFREPDGTRYLSMPLSVYYDEAQTANHEETIAPFREEFFMAVFEKTDSPDEKNVHIRYFEERVRNLVIASLRTNLTLSALKFKMKDFADDDAKFFTENAQSLIDKLIHPRRIFLIRLWQKETSFDSEKAAQEFVLPIEK